MPITLKHINYADSDTIKLDKVNYNFDQLVANGGGPLGPQGAIGQSGPQGTTGQQGFQGPIGDIGNQGTPGPVTDNYWYKPPASIILSPTSSTVDYIVPVYTPLDQFAPVVNIGYIDTEVQYGTKEALVGVKTPYQWLINRKAYSRSNLTLLNNDALGNCIDFKLEKIPGKDRLTIGFIDYVNSPTSVYQAALTIFKSTSISTETLVITDSSARFKTNTEINSPVTVHRRLIIQDPTAGTNKIVISEDSTGLAKFKSVQELGGTVPYGTIVSILPSVFLNNNNFINSETVNPGSGVVTISVGKGVNAYEGWYLCHGKDWTDGTPAGTYPVPMLGNFNYAIEDNPFSTDPTSQGGVSLTSNFRTHITGGSDVDMTATSVPGLVYNITSTVSTSTVQVGPSGGSIYKIKQLPQIIYLGRNDLYWFDPGTGQAPAVPVSWLLDDSNPNPSKLNPDPYPLGTVGNQPQGASYIFTSEVETPGGYYWLTVPTPGDITGVPAWATITGISLVPGQGAFPTRIAISISVSSHPAASPNQSPVNLGINTSAFISAAAATILLQRSNPSNTTVNLGTSYNINYNFATGYSFTLVITADFYYAFTTAPAIIYSLTGGATYTITSSTLSADVYGPNRVLTLDITITGVAVGITSLLYTLTVPIVSTRPTASGYSGSPIYIHGTGNVAPPNRPYTSYTVAVTNNTSGTIYVWVGINNFGGVSASGNTNSSVTGNWGALSVSAPPVPVGNTGNNYYYSLAYYTISNVSGSNTLNAALWSPATSDSYHTVKLYWATSVGGTKTEMTT